MDSNSFRGKAGVGEREGRVACPMVARRNHHLSHGIGRSGDIAAEQPKAAGSSLLTRIAHFLVLHALKLAGMQDMATVQVFPVATGMTLTLAFLACAASRPSAKYVLWSRIDQKTCLKSITAANLVPVVVPLQLVGDQLETDVDVMQRKIADLGEASIACIVTTTSCFAPRACDNVEAVARMSEAHSIPHVINNAYGVQSTEIGRRVTRASRVGRVDVVVQSTDKNFMVPVGGAVAAAPKGCEGGVLRDMAARYPGRAGVSAHLDLMMTLLHLGQSGWLQLLRDREELFEYCKGKLGEVAEELGERLLHSPGNPISMGLTVDSFSAHVQQFQQSKRLATDHQRNHDQKQPQYQQQELELSRDAQDVFACTQKGGTTLIDCYSVLKHEVCKDVSASVTATEQIATAVATEEHMHGAAPEIPEQYVTTATEIRDSSDQERSKQYSECAAVGNAGPLTQQGAPARDPYATLGHSPLEPANAPYATSTHSQRHRAGNQQEAAGVCGPEGRFELPETLASGSQIISPVTASGSQILSQATSATVLGAMLWQRHVSGVRVVCAGKKQAVSGIEFMGYGSSYDQYPHDYMTAAVALGASKRDIDVYCDKIRRCWLPGPRCKG